MWAGERGGREGRGGQKGGGVLSCLTSHQEYFFGNAVKPTHLANVDVC